MKNCSYCKEDKDEDKFGKKNGTIRSQCKTCINKAKKERYKNNKETEVDKRWADISKEFEKKEEEGWDKDDKFYYPIRMGNKIHILIEGTKEAKDFLKIVNKPEKKNDTPFEKRRYQTLQMYHDGIKTIFMSDFEAWKTSRGW